MVQKTAKEKSVQDPYAASSEIGPIEESSTTNFEGSSSSLFSKGSSTTTTEQRAAKKTPVDWTEFFH